MKARQRFAYAAADRTARSLIMVGLELAATVRPVE